MKKIDKAIQISGKDKGTIIIRYCPSPKGELLTPNEHGYKCDCVMGCTSHWNEEADMSTHKQKILAEEEIICNGCNRFRCKKCYSGSRYKASVLTIIKRWIGR